MVDQIMVNDAHKALDELSQFYAGHPLWGKHVMTLAEYVFQLERNMDWYGNTAQLVDADGKAVDLPTVVVGEGNPALTPGTIIRDGDTYTTTATKFVDIDVPSLPKKHPGRPKKTED